MTLLPPDQANESGQTGISFSGAGWRQVDLTITGPDGAIYAEGHIPGADINAGIAGWPLAAPGLYRFRLVDNLAGCVREFSLEARAP